MASDIPDQRHASPEAMARCLTSYIDCPDKVFRRIHDEFGTSPCRDTLRKLRASHLRPPTPVEPAKPHDGYYPQDASKALAATSALFLIRLQDERSRSELAAW